MRVLLQPAFILHRRPYRNSSLLLEAFSRDYGRLGLVARGAAAARSRLKHRLQPFIPLLLSWVGDGELVTLTNGEEAGPPFLLQGRRAVLGLYANELLVRLVPRRDSVSNLFSEYAALLAKLTTAVDEEPPLRCFEKRLLEELGYGLNLERTADSNQPLVAEACYRYVLEQGPLAAEHSALGIPISGRSLLALREERFTTTSAEVRKEVKRLMRAALANQLQGRTLRSRDLYR